MCVVCCIKKTDKTEQIFTKLGLNFLSVAFPLYLDGKLWNIFLHSRKLLGKLLRPSVGRGGGGGVVIFGSVKRANGLCELLHASKSYLLFVFGGGGGSMLVYFIV